VRRKKPVSRPVYGIEKHRGGGIQGVRGIRERVIIESIKTKVRYAKEGEVCLCMCTKSECMGLESEGAR